MKYNATTVSDYLSQLPEARKQIINKIRSIINKKIPKGFQEGVAYGMIGWSVPHTIYPPGYHCNPKDPLPFMGVASQKNFIAVYHMGIYADPKLYQWFTEAHQLVSVKKLDMGKSCIRYKKEEDIPLQLLGELASKITPKEWIELYESKFRRK